MFMNRCNNVPMSQLAQLGRFDWHIGSLVQWLSV